jgi:hypothetical protein
VDIASPDPGSLAMSRRAGYMIDAHVMSARSNNQRGRARRAQAVTASGPRRAWASATLYAGLVIMRLMSGLFWAWGVAVMPGRGRLDDRTFATLAAEHQP